MRADRIRELESYIQKKQSATLTELCEAFNVSLNTIRRDIKALLATGRVTKVYGGILYNRDDQVVPVNDRSAIAVEEKDQIGRLAASLVDDNETVYLDSGTTAAYMLPYLANKHNVTIVSNSFIIYNEMQRYPEMNLFSTGGLYNHKTKSFVGMSTINGLQDIRISKAFMSSTGISLELGATNNSFHEAEIKKSVIKQAQKVILMSDHSKTDTAAAICFCRLEQLFAYVTDRKPPEEYVQFFEQHNIQLLY